MKIEPKKKYLCRNGRVAEIAYIDDGHKYPIDGKVLHVPYEGIRHYWLEDGSSSVNGEHPYDIVSEYVEPTIWHTADEVPDIGEDIIAKWVWGEYQIINKAWNFKRKLKKWAYMKDIDPDYKE